MLFLTIKFNKSSWNEIDKKDDVVIVDFLHLNKTFNKRSC